MYKHHPAKAKFSEGLTAKMMRNDLVLVTFSITHIKYLHLKSLNTF